MARRAERLFEIIQILRGACRPVTAAALAGRLEVAERTVYRDVAALQARRVPIVGEAGVGYVLRPGFDLPPLMFTADEIDAIAAGVRMVRRIRDPSLNDAAGRVLAKVATVLPGGLPPVLDSAPIWVSDGSAAEPDGVDPADLRRAIRERRKVKLAYRDGSGRVTKRVVWPVAMAYYVYATLVAAWCELRAGIRHFRVERIVASGVLEERYPDDRGRLLAAWLALEKERPAAGARR